MVLKNLAASQADGLGRQARPKPDNLSAKRLGIQRGGVLNKPNAKWPYLPSTRCRWEDKSERCQVEVGPGTCTWRAPKSLQILMDWHWQCCSQNKRSQVKNLNTYYQSFFTHLLNFSDFSEKNGAHQLRVLVMQMSVTVWTPHVTFFARLSFDFSSL